MHASPSSATPRGTPSRRGRSPRFSSSDGISQAGSSAVPANHSNKTATFISSLQIPVEGAIPIETDDTKNSPTTDSNPPTLTESKRAPRKSKTDALAALNNQSRSSSTGPEEIETTQNITQKYRDSPPIPVSPRLDLSTVKTETTPRSVQNMPRPPRPFGLLDCPEYYPSVEEFKDPMAYIRSISSEASSYGICKIVPPEDWKMPFVTDTEAFRFKTRLQRLNSIEASSRAKLNFLEQLYQFHQQQGNPRVAVPTINHKPVDLWLLRKEVQKLGGYEAVSKGKKWSLLGQLLGYRGIQNLSTQIKNSYTRVILPYEHYCNRVRNSPSVSPVTARDDPAKTQNGSSSRLSTAVASTNGTSPPASPLTTTSSPLSEPPDEGDQKDVNGKSYGSRPRRSTRMSSQERSPRKAGSNLVIPSPVVPPPVFYDKPPQQQESKVGNPEVRLSNLQAFNNSSPTNYGQQQNCEICNKKNRGEEMLLCDGCDCGFHMFCLDPPLASVPKENWFCSACLQNTGGDFGFDEGEEHSLTSFQARDKEFRRLWFESHPPSPRIGLSLPQWDFMKTQIGNVTVTEYDVEEEFWRLVQSPNETVEIEYGADVHSTIHGSAMPTLETQPLDPYSKDPWNLNNIAILPDSLLRFIKSDISGMTVPWTYVGMAFSTFCWHNEDHYTYSINYMHWGETKTWYGIPGLDAEKFEAAIKKEAPDLFESQPDLLFQLVTLMNPQRLTEAGVRVFACNQRAGEFVITFPKAYHAGFNHGLNFNEAVNFALPDWLPLGRDCVQRYREHRKLPVFSHDELLVTITQQSHSIKTAIWLIDSLQEMVDREMADREKIRQLGITEHLSQEDRPEDQYQCKICKVFCYLSQVTCHCSNKIVCVDHWELLCDATIPLSHLVFRKRFSDEELTDTLNKISDKAGLPTVWKNKFNKLLSESARPPLRSLRALLAEGDRINYPLPEMATLRKCVARANEWLDEANSFIIRKQSRKRSRKSKGRASVSEVPGASDDPGDRPDRGLHDLYRILGEFENLGFDCQEIGLLQNLAQQAEEVKNKAAALLKAPPAEKERPEYLAECKRILLQGSSLNVYMEELLDIERIVDREELLNELEEKLEDGDSSVLTLDEIRQLLNRAKHCNLPDTNKYMVTLNERQRSGDNWEVRARRLLEQPVKTTAELEEIVKSMPSETHVDSTVVTRVMHARAKAVDYEKTAKSWLNPQPGSEKARLQEAVRLAARASKDFDIYSVTLLRRSADIATDLETRCENVLRNRFSPAEGEDVFTSIAKWKEYAQKHLHMFILPTFEKLEQQLRLHEAWVQTIPWYAEGNPEPHSKAVLEDVLETTRPEDDQPPVDEYRTCICNEPVIPPPAGGVSDAVECDHCAAKFHGACADNGGSCPFCDGTHWNGTITKARNYHFCLLPTILANAPDLSKHHSKEYKELEIIVHRVDRLASTIGQFLSFSSFHDNHLPGEIPRVRHYLRKLYKIQFAVSPNPDVSFGLDLAGLHRLLARRLVSSGRPPKKRRTPKLVFGQDKDQDWRDGTRCICRGGNDQCNGYPTVSCESCQRSYHIGCVFFPPDKSKLHNVRFTCPLCCLRKNKTYPHADIRVTPIEKSLGNDIYVNVKEILETCSSRILYKKLARPMVPTLFIELVEFIPGSDEVQSTPNAPASRPPHMVPQHPPMSWPHPSHPPQSFVAHGPPLTNSHPPSAMNTFATVTPQNGSYAPPPPPWNHNNSWSRWGAVTTPSMPPSTHRRGTLEPGRLNGTSQPSSSAVVVPNRKRKHVDEGISHDKTVDEDLRPSATPFSQKRHAGPSLTPTPISPPRSVQTLSPSLAMIVSPVNQAVHASPRGSQLAPLRNGPGGSPVLPPVGSLIPGPTSRNPL
ncbi:hypothetical protein CVT24_002136 [Panaeolus cyanescens]|uniref:[histone H3]-trimethyl-L-lysine(4) demethylase n=1 Tax=Panaeolus cyanescens TaxID=181874 RepID=A0A409YI00_9AGAR|nr:hypothetical protein CVT24_002136 [Panaeolus cyanescens]